MWLCSKCGAPGEDTFDACWKCGTPKGASAGASPAREDQPVTDDRATEQSIETEDAAPYEAAGPAIQCTRCDFDLEYKGQKLFQEGHERSLLSEIGEMFVSREYFDVFACPRCGHVEFFVAGIGEQLRPR